MPELYLPSQGEYEARVSPGLAIALTLPLVDLAPRFPGLEPWLLQLPGRLGRAARADVRLLSEPLSGALSYVLHAPDDEESLQPALDVLRRTPAEEIRKRVVSSLAEHFETDESEVERLLHEEPERLQHLIKSMGGPSADDSFSVDADRAVALLRSPEELKQLIEFRLQQLWHDHFAERWREALPAARALARAARSRFHLGDAELVAQGVLGRRLPERVPLTSGAKFVFCPVPFLGPYLSIATEENEGRAVVYIGFGIARGVEEWEEATHRDLLATLRVLADEARLNALAHVRRHGRACAADLMERFGWSQPATSRHLRALASVGLLDVERVDGVKWYSINTQRAKAVVQGLDRFLAGE